MSAAVFFLVLAGTVIAALTLPAFVGSVVAALALTGVAVPALHSVNEALIRKDS